MVGLLGHVQRLVCILMLMVVLDKTFENEKDALPTACCKTYTNLILFISVLGYNTKISWLQISKYSKMPEFGRNKCIDLCIR